MNDMYHQLGWMRSGLHPPYFNLYSSKPWHLIPHYHCFAPRLHVSHEGNNSVKGKNRATKHFQNVILPLSQGSKMLSETECQ